MITPEIFLILASCIVGAVWTSYKTGLRKGIETTLTQLEDAGVIQFDPE
tara:strand:+ start:221 stop:367 length:147 start_codon:yes stop_codon:yes gene_type:complete